MDEEKLKAEIRTLRWALDRMTKRAKELEHMHQLDMAEIVRLRRMVEAVEEGRT